MTVPFDLNPELEQGLLAQARERGVSVGDYLREIVSRQVRDTASQAAPKGKTLKLPALPLGTMGSLHRRDIYDDVP
jgi:hypothetical protein